MNDDVEELSTTNIEKSKTKGRMIFSEVTLVTKEFAKNHNLI